MKKFLRELIFANYFSGHFAGINFRELGFTEDFAEINFGELGHIRISGELVFANWV